MNLLYIITKIMQYKSLNGNPKTEIKLFFLITFLKHYELILMYLLKLALDDELDRGWPAACARCLKVTRHNKF